MENIIEELDARVTSINRYATLVIVAFIVMLFVSGCTDQRQDETMILQETEVHIVKDKQLVNDKCATTLTRDSGCFLRGNEKLGIRPQVWWVREDSTCEHELRHVAGMTHEEMDRLGYR